MSRVEAVGRAQFHLAMVMRAQHDKWTVERSREAEDLEILARTVRENYVPSTTQPRTYEEDYRLHDFIVSMWAGRTGLTPKS